LIFQVKIEAMKTLKLFFLFSAIAMVLASGCKKSELTTPVSLPKTLKELKAADSFNWTTGMAVELQITGLPTLVPVKSTLTVNLANGTTLFSKLHQMDENAIINLTVPTTEKELTLRYGSVTYLVAITNNKAFFSFIPVVTD